MKLSIRTTLKLRHTIEDDGPAMTAQEKIIHGFDLK
jgi:hypothetical protein